MKNAIGIIANKEEITIKGFILFARLKPQKVEVIAGIASNPIMIPKLSVEKLSGALISPKNIKNNNGEAVTAKHIALNIIQVFPKFMEFCFDIFLQ
jgi:hypothetical protein